MGCARSLQRAYSRLCVDCGRLWSVRTLGSRHYWSHFRPLVQRFLLGMPHLERWRSRWKDCCSRIWRHVGSCGGGNIWHQIWIGVRISRSGTLLLVPVARHAHHSRVDHDLYRSLLLSALEVQSGENKSYWWSVRAWPCSHRGRGVREDQNRKNASNLTKDLFLEGRRIIPKQITDKKQAIRE